MIEMKDRIKQVMESQHMTQQVFAQFIEMSPATLSSIFNGRTNPTMNIVGAIKRKIPNISTDWLMFGTEPMFLAPKGQTATPQSAPNPNVDLRVETSEPILDFDMGTAPTPQPNVSGGQNFNSVKNTRREIVREEVKHIDKPQRRVIEIRVFYDDQTWDTFVPAKK